MMSSHRNSPINFRQGTSQLCQLHGCLWHILGLLLHCSCFVNCTSLENPWAASLKAEHRPGCSQPFHFHLCMLHECIRVLTKRPILECSQQHYS